MPEGDTVYKAAQRLRETLGNREVTTFDLRVPRLALADLTGTQTIDVVSVGKHLLMRFSNGRTLHSHLRMDGAWLVRRVGERKRAGPEHAVRALIGNADWLAIGVRVHDLALLSTAEEDTVVGHLGPDLLDPDADLAEARRRLEAQPDRDIGQALLDQRNLAGIGNVYKSELLFLHGLDPWSAVGGVADLPAVIIDAVRLLRANLIGAERSTTGWRQPGQQYWVYGRAGKACRRCGTAIERRDEDQQERITFYCPTCQKTR